MLSAVLPWIILAAVILIPVIAGFLGEDEEPPDPGDDDQPALAAA